MARSALFVLAGCALAQAVPSFTTQKAVALTPEQAQILAHFRLVNTDDGFGNPLPTIQIVGANVQLVNGMGHTRDTNGLGNLIVGYQEAGGSSNRTGSHNVILGDRNDYTSYAGLCSGDTNQLHGPWATVLSGFYGVAHDDSCVVIGGTANEAAGYGGVVIGGEGNSITSQDELNVMVGATNSTVLNGRQNVIVGGYGHTIDGGDLNAVVGGDRTEVRFSDLVATLGGEGGHVLAEGATLVGGKQNTIGTGLNTSGATVVGGQGNTVTGQDFGTLVGGQGNTLSGRWATLTGGLNRFATGAHDWVAGALFQDN